MDLAVKGVRKSLIRKPDMGSFQKIPGFFHDFPDKPVNVQGFLGENLLGLVFCGICHVPDVPQKLVKSPADLGGLVFRLRIFLNHAGGQKGLGGGEHGGDGAAQVLGHKSHSLQLRGDRSFPEGKNIPGFHRRDAGFPHPVQNFQLQG